MIKKEYFIDLGKTILIFILASLIGFLFTSLHFTEVNIVVIYILAVLITARITNGYIFGIIASIFSILGFNYFFTAPYHTFNVYDPNYFITFAIMAITSIVTSTLTSTAKMYTKKAEDKEAESLALYNLTNQLSDAEDTSKILEIGLSNICNLINNDAGIAYFKETNKQILIQKLNHEFIYRNSSEVADIHLLLKNLRTEYAEENGYIDFPIRVNDKLLGAIHLKKEVWLSLDEDKKRLLHSMIENIAIALDRILVTKERILDREAAVRERYRANLLRAISHDLRTPLTGIMGTVEMIMDMTDNDDQRYEMMQGIYKDADWLHSMVENILSLTRLKDGNMDVKKEPEALEEVIAAAITHTERIYPSREIQVKLPDDFVLVPMDARLIQQVINNLLDNAIKHTTVNDKITIIVSYDNDIAKVCVQDEGVGIDKKDEKNIFQMFYTSGNKSADANKGVGLGLAICETVIKAHGGKIYANNRSDGKGAEFTFELPIKI
ncbi:MAG: DUF4118 domain-containing protein [Thomasclavelia sp.]|nr:DUF4118 domain-containing protein [Thomasclavelia sp.]